MAATNGRPVLGESTPEQHRAYVEYKLRVRSSEDLLGPIMDMVAAYVDETHRHRDLFQEQRELPLIDTSGLPTPAEVVAAALKDPRR